MVLQVSFRTVGLYCYLENLQLEGISSDSTVLDVMKQVRAQEPAFNFHYGPTTSGKEIVDSLSYDFTDSSTTPFNASGRPANGNRELSNQISSLGLVWQYYRSVTGTIDGTVCEIKFLQRGQPSFATTPLNYYDPYFGAIPEGFEIHTYNLTWRLVQIELNPENQAKFAAARTAAFNKR